jgi:DNA-binding YbaB/EbfC family protein
LKRQRTLKKYTLEETKMRANIPKGMGGGPQNMQAMIRQAQKMQEDMAALQEDLDAREYEIKAGGGVVGVKINGKKEILSIDIQPEIVDPDDIETLSDILVAAVNEAIKRVETVNAEEMDKVTKGLNMPGMF